MSNSLPQRHDRCDLKMFNPTTTRRSAVGLLICRWTLAIHCASATWPALAQNAAISRWSLAQHHGSQAQLIEPAAPGGPLRVEIAKLGDGPPWQVQLVSIGHAIQDKSKCKLRFEMRSEAPRRVVVGAALNYAPWTNVGLYQELDVTDRWQEISLEFEPAQVDGNVRLHFDLGASPAAFEIRGLQMGGALVSSAPQAAPEPMPAATAAAASAAPLPAPAHLPQASAGVEGLLPAGNLVAQPGCAAELVPRDDAPQVNRIRILRTDGQWWHVRYSVEPVALRQGQTYRLTFRTRADRARAIAVEVQQREAPWGALGLRKTVAVTDRWQSFALEFTPPADEAQAAVHFSLGQDLPAVELAEIAISPSVTGGVSAGIATAGPADEAPIRSEWMLSVGKQAAAVLLPGSESGALRVAIERAPGSAQDALQLKRLLPGLQAGESYRVRFRLRGDGARAIVCRLVNNHYPPTPVGLSEHLQVGPDWQTVERGFVATETCNSAEFQVLLGGNDTDLELADLTLCTEAAPDRNLLGETP